MASSTRTARPPLWFCHECNRELLGEPLRLPDPHCPTCHSTFVEDIFADSHLPPDPIQASFHYPSPPIPSTRQRYDEQEQEREAHAAPPNLPEMLGPLFNLFGLPQFLRNPSGATSSAGENPNPSTTNSSRSEPLRRSRSNPQMSNTASGPAGGTWSASLNSDSNETGQPQFNTGVYTFTFDSSNNDTTDSNQQARPPNIPNFFTSMVQQAISQASQRHTPTNPTSNTDHSMSNNDREGDEDEDPSRLPSFVDEFETRRPDTPRPREGSAPRWSDDGGHFHTGPTPNRGSVNLEQDHPLRQFITMLNSLSTPDGMPNREGFVFNGGGNGFGFTANFGVGGGAGQFGDYVLSEMGMQDVIDQLMNMAGANSGHNPVPATEAKIKSLKKFKVDAKILESEIGECAICKDAFMMEEDCMELPCHHIFHSEDCITPWLKRNGTCPVCRFSLVNDPTDDPDDVPLNAEGSGGHRTSEDDHVENRTMSELSALAAEERRNRGGGGARVERSDADELLIDPLDVD